MQVRDVTMTAVLWRSGLFDSFDISCALGLSEADVMQVVDVMAGGAALRVVAGLDVDDCAMVHPAPTN